MTLGVLAIQQCRMSIWRFAKCHDESLHLVCCFVWIRFAIRHMHKFVVKMDSVFSVEEILGLKCPQLVVNEVEIETSDNPIEIPSNTALNTRTNATKEVPFFEDVDYTNGALFDELNYCWSQTINEIGELMMSRIPTNRIESN